MGNAQTVTNDRAPDTTDPAALAVFCTKWKLNAGDLTVLAFLDESRATGATWADWSAAFRAWRRNVPSGRRDDLDDLDVPGVHRVAVEELGMEATCAGPMPLAPATVSRVTARLPTLAMTLWCAQQRTPWLLEQIRRARREGTTKRPEAATPTEATMKNGETHKP